MVSRVVIAAALGLTALAAAVALVTVMSVPRPGALLIERMPIDGMMLRQGMVGQQLSYSYSDIVQNEFPFAGRCRYHPRYAMPQFRCIRPRRRLLPMTEGLWLGGGGGRGRGRRSGDGRRSGYVTHA